MQKSLQERLLCWFERFYPRMPLIAFRARLSKSLPKLLMARRLMLAGKLKIAGNGASAASTRDKMGQALQEEFEYLWKHGNPWELDSSQYEQEKYLRQLALINDRRFGRVLEIGSGNACFSRLMSRIADKVLALDISESAIARAREICAGFDNIEFRVANIMDFDVAAEGPFDLMVMSETIYYWVAAYGPDEVTSQVRRLFDATNQGGKVLMANSMVKQERRTGDPSIARTYGDIVIQAGFQLEHEETFLRSHNGERLGSLISVFRKP